MAGTKGGADGARAASVRVKLSSTKQTDRAGRTRSLKRRPVLPVLVLHIQQREALSGENDLSDIKGPRGAMQRGVFTVFTDLLHLKECWDARK